MKTKFNAIPKPMKIQILTRCVISILSFALALVMLIIANDFLLGLPCIVLFGYMLISGGAMLYHGITKNFVAVKGSCIQTEKSHIFKRLKAIRVQTDKGQIKISVRKKFGRVKEGDEIIIYLPSTTRVYEQDACLVIFEYFAIDIIRTNNLNSV